MFDARDKPKPPQEDKGSPWHDELLQAMADEREQANQEKPPEEAADAGKPKKPAAPAGDALAQLFGDFEVAGNDKPAKSPPDKKPEQAEQPNYYLDIAEKVLKALAAAYGLKAAIDAANPRRNHRDTEPVRRAFLGDRPLNPGDEVYLTAEGEFAARKDGKARATKVTCDAKGQATVEVVDPAAKAYIKDGTGKIRTVTKADGAIELKPGESLAVGKAEFRTFETASISPFKIKLISKGHEPVQGEVTIDVDPSKVYELGRGKQEGAQVKKDGVVRYEIGVPGVSAEHARIGMDAGGMYIIDGRVVNSSGDVAPSTYGTFVNGEKLPPGQKKYVTSKDKIEIGLSDFGAHVEVKLEPSDMNRPAQIKESQCIKATVLTNPQTGTGYSVAEGREIILGRQGHVDPGGKHLADQHAKLRVDTTGNAFIKAEPGDNKVYIERENGKTQVAQAADGWVPLGKGDRISVGGSPMLDLSAELLSPTEIHLGDRHYSLKPGETIEIGRGESETEGQRKISVDKAGLSRTHAEVGVDEKGRMYIVDVGSEGKGSTNGTYVNGKKITPNERTYITPQDTVWLAEPNSTKGTELSVRPIDLGGDKVSRGEERIPDPPKRAFRLSPREAAPLPAVTPVDPAMPTDLRGSIVVGGENGRKIRILGGLGDPLPHESIALTQAQKADLGKSGSAFEPITLWVRGEEVTYYRNRENPQRFYLLSENGPNGPKLVRDYEVFTEPDTDGRGGKDGAAKPPKPNSDDKPRGDEDKTNKPDAVTGDKVDEPKKPTPPDSASRGGTSSADEMKKALASELPRDFTVDDIKSKVVELLDRETKRGDEADPKRLEELSKLQKLVDDPLSLQKLKETLTETRKGLTNVSTPGGAQVVSDVRLENVGAQTGSIKDGVAVADRSVEAAPLPKEALSEIDNKHGDLNEKLKQAETKLKESPADKGLQQEVRELNSQIRALETAKNTPSGRARLCDWIKQNGGTAKAVGGIAFFVFIFTQFAPKGQASDRVNHAGLVK